MKYVKFLLLAGLMVLSILAVLPASAAVATPRTTTLHTEVVRATQESYVVESAHPYTNNFDYTWTITKSGATSIKVYFSYIDVESNYDFVYVYDYAGTQLHKITGSSSGWSAASAGDTIKVRLDTDYSVTKNGFKITMIEYETSSGGGSNVLTSGVAATSSLSATGTTEMWTINVDSGATNMHSVLTCGSADFDLYGRLGAEPTTSSYNWRGYTSGGEDVSFDNPGAGTWYIMVRSYSGSGSYSLTVTLTYATADTVAPTVSIASPNNGATVSGSVTVSVSASDNVGVVGRAISIDGGSYTTSLTWDTTAATDGSHTIRARAWDAAGNYGYSTTITVTVDNYVPPSNNELQDGTPASGSLSAQGATYTYTMVVDANCVSMHAVLTCGSADFDLYGRLGAEPTTSTYDWRGYTSGGEDVTTNNPGAGTWYIMVRSYSGTGAYTLTVDLTYNTNPNPSGEGKYALIVGISNYKAINDLSYCDEDATDWYNYLVNVMGYPSANIRILGDGTSSYPKTPYGKATEYNYKQCLAWLCSQDAEEIAFITSGHGAGDGNGNSYLCAWDCSSGESGEDGDFYDYEIQAALQNAQADRVFVFIDHCYSGGIGPEIQSLGAKFYCTTTCTEDGYGYDDAQHSNGAWTYYFLEYTLINHFGSSTTTTMESAFDYAAAAYPHSGGDAPMEFDANPSSGFTL